MTPFTAKIMSRPKDFIFFLLALNQIGLHGAVVEMRRGRLQIGPDGRLADDEKHLDCLNAPWMLHEGGDSFTY